MVQFRMAASVSEGFQVGFGRQSDLTREERHSHCAASSGHVKAATNLAAMVSTQDGHEQVAAGSARTGNRSYWEELITRIRT